MGTRKLVRRVEFMTSALPTSNFKERDSRMKRGWLGSMRKREMEREKGKEEGRKTRRKGKRKAKGRRKGGRKKQ